MLTGFFIFLLTFAFVHWLGRFVPETQKMDVIPRLVMEFIMAIACTAVSGAFLSIIYG